MDWKNHSRRADISEQYLVDFNEEEKVTTMEMPLDSSKDYVVKHIIKPGSMFYKLRLRKDRHPSAFIQWSYTKEVCMVESNWGPAMLYAIDQIASRGSPEQ